MFLRVFKKLKQRVIWKWEDDHLAGKPDNVMIGKWLPQNDILGTFEVVFSSTEVISLIFNNLVN